MFLIKEGTQCAKCDTLITGWDYRYQGEHYCRKCYDRNFENKICEGCGQNKRIKKKLSPALCKKCLVKDLPCIRCGKLEYLNGQITKLGPVCNSCSKYFREPKKCSSCETKKVDVANRNLKNGLTALLCNGCYQKSELLVCSICSKRRHEFFYDFSKRHICKNCLTFPQRHCKYCSVEIPAGSGLVCHECSYGRTLERRIRYLSPLLNRNFQKVLNDFSQWLVARKGIGFAAIKIGYYFKFIHELNNLAITLNSFPSYADIVNNLTVAKTRQYLLVTAFLSETKAIKIDTKIKDEFSNLDMIDRYLNHFEKNSTFGKMINAYYEKLQLKLEDGKTSIRSIRLALTPAINYLKNCAHFGFSQPSQEVLKGFLWSSPGQRSAITGFINFLRDTFGTEITLDLIPKVIELQRPYLSKKMLKQRFIDLLRDSKGKEISDDQLLRASIAYLHGVEIPDFVRISREDILKNKAGEYYLRMANENFYIPVNILHFLLLKTN